MGVGQLTEKETKMVLKALPMLLKTETPKPEPKKEVKVHYISNLIRINEPLSLPHQQEVRSTRHLLI